MIDNDEFKIPKKYAGPNKIGYEQTAEEADSVYMKKKTIMN